MAKQLTLAQRYHIAVRLSEGKMQKDIAEKIGTSCLTLTQELQHITANFEVFFKDFLRNAA